MNMDCFKKDIDELIAQFTQVMEIDLSLLKKMSAEYAEAKNVAIKVFIPFVYYITGT